MKKPFPLVNDFKASLELLCFTEKILFRELRTQTKNIIIETYRHNKLYSLKMLSGVPYFAHPCARAIQFFQNTANVISHRDRCANKSDYNLSPSGLLSVCLSITLLLLSNWRSLQRFPSALRTDDFRDSKQRRHERRRPHESRLCDARHSPIARRQHCESQARPRRRT